MKKPNTQVQEVLYMLITECQVSTRSLFNHCGILNPTARISDIRRLGIDVCVRMLGTKNKFGRPIKYGVFWLNDKEKAIKIYNEING